MTSKLQGPERKVALPFHGPYCVIRVTLTNAEVPSLSKPGDLTIIVAFSRVRQCYLEQSDEV